MRWSDGSYLEDQDKWWLSGIYREVFIHSFSLFSVWPADLPQVYLIRKDLAIRISDYELRSHIQWTNANLNPPTADAADLTLDISLEYDPQVVTTHRYSLRVDIFSPQPLPSLVLTVSHPLSLPLPSARRPPPLHSEIQAHPFNFETCSISLNASLSKPHLWTAETPYLYFVVMTIVKDEGTSPPTEIDIESCCLGLKEVSISGTDNQLCVNGVPLLIAGVNHHEFHPNTGRSISVETMLQDIHLLKQFNFNAVRLSHYPHHHIFLELCSRHGLYVIDECNIETHGFQWSGQAVGYLSSQPEWFDAHLSRVMRMYERDKNMTAIIGWSLGNESGVGEAHRRMYRWLKNRDKTGRFVQYESGGATTEITDIICPMYLRPDWCLNQALHDPKRRPVILCEYAHSMGNSSGGLAHYWKCFQNPDFPRLQGGFIWDFVDQGLSLDPTREGCYGYGGDFNDFPNTAQFCINGIFSPNRLPHPIAFEAAALQSPVDFQLHMEQSTRGNFRSFLTLHNRRSFLTLSDIILEIDIESTIVPLPQHNSPHSISLKNFVTIFPRSSETIDITVELEFVVESYVMRLKRLLTNGNSSIRRSSVVPLEYWISITAFSIKEKKHILKRLTLTHHLLPLAMESRISVLPSPQTFAFQSSEPRILSSDDTVTLNWSNGNSVILQRRCGGISSWNIQGNEILKSPLALCFWRAPTDNDRSSLLSSHLLLSH